MTDNKYDENLRTFESRLLFLQSLYSNKYSQQEIMANCIKYKLGRTYIFYVEDLEKNIDKLREVDELKLLKKINQNIK